jgi:hypothetical protein
VHTMYTTGLWKLILEHHGGADVHVLIANAGRSAPRARPTRSILIEAGSLCELVECRMEGR